MKSNLNSQGQVNLFGSSGRQSAKAKDIDRKEILSLGTTEMILSIMKIPSRSSYLLFTGADFIQPSINTHRRARP